MRPPPNVVNAAVKEGHSNFVFSDDAIPQQCSVDNGRDRNIFPNSNSPTPPSSRRYERCERNRGLLRQLSHRFGFRSNDDLNDSAANDDDNQSSSTESCSSSQATTTTTSAKGRERSQQQQQQQLQQQCMESMLVSGTSSETSSTIEDIEEAVSITQQQQQQQQEQQNGKYENDENDSQVGEGGEEEEEEDQEQDENAKQQQQQQAHHHHHNNNGRRFNSRASFSRLQRRSTSTIRRALESFSLTTRSLSCSGATPPLQSQHSDSECNTPKSSNNSTPIKSSLKCSSNLELHKKTSNTTLIAVNHQQQQHHYSFSAASSAHGPNHTHNNCNVIKTAKQTKTKQPPQRILRQPVSYTYLKGISGLPTQRVPRNSVCCQYARR